jgi:hypothetical protein
MARDMHPASAQNHIAKHPRPQRVRVDSQGCNPGAMNHMGWSFSPDRVTLPYSNNDRGSSVRPDSDRHPNGLTLSKSVRLGARADQTLNGFVLPSL